MDAQVAARFTAPIDDGLVMPTFATCICTMNRPDELRKAIVSLHECSPRPNDILVSDDSPESDRRSEKVCREFPLVRYQCGPRLGLGANRNACIGAVAIEWIHFIDDDVIVPADFYSTATAITSKKNSQKTVISGIEFKHDQGSKDPLLVSPPALSFWGYMRPANGAAPECVVMNATLFPAELFRQVQFDANFRYGCEEADITQAAIHHGYTIHVAPELSVNHYPSRENRATYASQRITSQVYFGLKRQQVYRRSWIGSIGFTLLAIPRIVLHSTRMDGLAGFFASIRQAVQGFQLFFAAKPK